MSDEPSQPQAAPIKPQRILACVLCQQRKVKCDRKFPCVNCRKNGAQCIPATLVPRQRRRRFRERDLLDRLRRYEDLLKQNKVNFEPLHEDGGDSRNGSEDEDEQDRPARTGVAGTPGSTTSQQTKNEPITPVYEAKNFWYAMTRSIIKPGDLDDAGGTFTGSDEVREKTVAQAWNQLYTSNSHLLFGSRETTAQLSTLHPQQIHIFRLWQIYADNSQIINAAGDLSKVDSKLEALMFAVYSMAVLSLSEEECSKFFDQSKKNLLTNYQFGCEQALLNSDFLRTDDRNCLTALFLYLISAKPDTDPRTMASLLAIAMRIAQRMAIHQESANASREFFEAEMRRRLWWALVIVDARSAEMSDNKSTNLLPTWDCKIPLNASDFDLRPEMTALPTVHNQPTEASFIVVRSEMYDFTRNSAWHLDFVNPAMKKLANPQQPEGTNDVDALVQYSALIEDKYLKLCYPENALQYMTICFTRSHLARMRLMTTWVQFSSGNTPADNSLYDAASSACIEMLKTDTAIVTSPLTRGYCWLAHSHFPFIAYLHLSQDLRRRPATAYADEAWTAMSDNYANRFVDSSDWDTNPFYRRAGMGMSSWYARPNDNPFFKILAHGLLEAWAACVDFKRKAGLEVSIPPMVTELETRMREMEAEKTADTATQNQPVAPVTQTTPSTFLQGSFIHSDNNGMYSIQPQPMMDTGGTSFPPIGGMADLQPFDLTAPMDWSSFDWGNMQMQGW